MELAFDFEKSNKFNHSMASIYNATDITQNTF